jgi:hypothetical protein
VYFVTASGIDGRTDPFDVLASITLFGGISGLLWLGLLLAVWRWPRVAAGVLFVLAALLGTLTTVVPLVGAIGFFGPAVPAEVLLGTLSTGLVTVLLPLVGGWLVLAAAGPGRHGAPHALALPVGVAVLGLTLAAVLWLVVGNLPEVRAPWLLWLNYAFLALLAGLLAWQLRAAWVGAGADLSPRLGGRARSRS